MFEIAGVSEEMREATFWHHTNCQLKQKFIGLRGKWWWIEWKVNELRKNLRLPTAENLLKRKWIKTELFNLRFQLATGQLEGTARIREIRRHCAAIQDCIARQKNCKNNHISKEAMNMTGRDVNNAQSISGRVVSDKDGQRNVSSCNRSLQKRHSTR